MALPGRVDSCSPPLHSFSSPATSHLVLIYWWIMHEYTSDVGSSTQQTCTLPTMVTNISNESSPLTWSPRSKSDIESLKRREPECVLNSDKSHSPCNQNFAIRIFIGNRKMVALRYKSLGLTDFIRKLINHNDRLLLQQLKKAGNQNSWKMLALRHKLF